jgi:hypothetical protein
MDTMNDLRALIIEMRGDMNRQFAEAREDTHRRFSDINQRVQSLDEKEDRHFTWVIGIQVASILAVVGVLASAYYR